MTERKSAREKERETNKKENENSKIFSMKLLLKRIDCVKITMMSSMMLQVEFEN